METYRVRCGGKTQRLRLYKPVGWFLRENVKCGTREEIAIHQEPLGWLLLATAQVRLQPSCTACLDYLTSPQLLDIITERFPRQQRHTEQLEDPPPPPNCSAKNPKFTFFIEIPSDYYHLDRCDWWWLEIRLSGSGFSSFRVPFTECFLKIGANNSILKVGRIFRIETRAVEWAWCENDSFFIIFSPIFYEMGFKIRVFSSWCYFSNCKETNFSNFSIHFLMK